MGGRVKGVGDGPCVMVKGVGWCGRGGGEQGGGGGGGQGVGVVHQRGSGGGGQGGRGGASKW